MNTVVIISPYFPPSSLAGVHRARHLVNHLPEHGWSPVLIRVDPRHYSELPDPDLVRLVRDDLEEVRTGAFPSSVTQRFGVGDLGIRALSFLAHALDQSIARTNPDVVLLTGAPFYPLLLSRYIKWRHAVPVVVDLQDPWVSSYGAGQPLLSKRRMTNAVAKVLEPLALQGADAVTSVSETQNSDLRARYPFLAGRPMKAIPIGGDPEDFQALRLWPPLKPLVQLDRSKINLNYVGTFLPRAEPLARSLFEALADLAAERPGLANQLRLNFVGTSNQPAPGSASPVTALARVAGVEHLVSETPQRVPYLEALSLLANANGLLMIGSDEMHYTASKIYPSLMSGQPYLSLYHAASSSHEILSRAGGGIALSFDSSAALDALKSQLTAALLRLTIDGASLGNADPAAYQSYTAHSIAGQYAALFAGLVAKRHVGLT